MIDLLRNQQGFVIKTMDLKRSIAILVISLIVSLIPLSGISAQDQGPVYIVQPGDTLYSIAIKFGTTIEVIAAANSLSDPYIISLGMRLVIPGFEGVSGVLDFRKIQFGETLSSLASRYGIPPDAIVRLNRVLNPDRFFIGQSAILSIPEQEVIQERLVLTNPADTSLTFSLKNDLNPWELHDLDRPLDRLWVIPSESLAMEIEGDQVTSGLPTPIQSVEVTPERAVQGRTILVRVEVESEIEVMGNVAERDLHFQSHLPREKLVVQGIHALLEPGMYDLTLSFVNLEGVEFFKFVQPLRIASGDYYFDPPLYVPPETIDPLNTEPENELVTSIVNDITAEKYWEGAFQFPSTVTDLFSSVFGSRRNYNDMGYTSYHSGLDFYGGTGSPIYSPARGKVVFAGSLEVRGNVTFIDHGWGVFTGYLHQSEILVSVGDLVEEGDEIGKVGGSGRVTGPHLHWEVWVGGVPVDPLEWTSEVFP